MIDDNPLEPQGCAACDLGEKFTDERAFVHTGVGAFCKGKQITKVPDLGVDVVESVVFTKRKPGRPRKVPDGAPTVGGSATVEINALVMGVVPTDVARLSGQRATGHPSVGAPSGSVQPTPPAAAAAPNNKCGKCGAVGHVEQDCWVTARDAAKRGISAADLKKALLVPKKIAAAQKAAATNGCTICGGTKHSTDDCPANPANPPCDTCGLRHSNAGPCPNAKFFKKR
jgi:hypothetical protein